MVQGWRPCSKTERYLFIYSKGAHHTCGQCFRGILDLHVAVHDIRAMKNNIDSSLGILSQLVVNLRSYAKLIHPSGASKTQNVLNKRDFYPNGCADKLFKNRKL